MSDDAEALARERVEQADREVQTCEAKVAKQEDHLAAAREALKRAHAERAQALDAFNELEEG